jgi:hypothetical protein
LLSHTKLSPILGCRFKVFTSRRLVLYSTPANQIIIISIRSHFGGPLGTILLTAHSWELNTQIVQYTPTPEDHLVLLLTIHSWELKSSRIVVVHRTGSSQINALPLRRTSWHHHSYHSLLGFMHALFPGIGRSLLVLVIALSRLSFTWSLSIPTTTDSYHFVPAAPVAFVDPPRRDLIISRGSWLIPTRTPRTFGLIGLFFFFMET